MLDLHVVREFDELGLVFDNIKLWVDEDVPRVEDRRQYDYRLNSLNLLNRSNWDTVSWEYSLAASHRVLYCNYGNSASIYFAARQRVITA